MTKKNDSKIVHNYRFGREVLLNVHVDGSRSWQSWTNNQHSFYPTPFRIRLILALRCLFQ